ncbi:MAG: dephospho-CoA kinase [Candidatus Eremiobacteraeota bacterium]|nr:dephospho-CoA kinase [Candidatus Eremiobacteraeota bacterium]
MRAGLTGGIGAGKSAVARILSDLGAYIVDTDALAREAAAPNSDGLREIARAWPHVVRSGALDRTALAEIVFSDPAARERLNAILHPHIRRLAMERDARAKPGQPIVHIVPLLFETGYDRLVDKTIVVVAPENDRIARVAARDGIDEERIRARMAAQIAPEEAQRRADYVVLNDGNLGALRERTEQLYDELTGAG